MLECFSSREGEYRIFGASIYYSTHQGRSSYCSSLKQSKSYTKSVMGSVESMVFSRRIRQSRLDNAIKICTLVFADQYSSMRCSNMRIFLIDRMFQHSLENSQSFLSSIHKVQSLLKEGVPCPSCRIYLVSWAYYYLS